MHKDMYTVGRFGNQMSQYIGAVAFAKGLDRTLVLPPFIKYPPMAAGSVSQLYNVMCSSERFIRVY